MDKIKKYNQCDKLEQCRICNSYDVCLAWVKFVSIHNETKTYAHFDKRVSLMMPSIRKYVRPGVVERHYAAGRDGDHH